MTENPLGESVAPQNNSTNPLFETYHQEDAVVNNEIINTPPPSAIILQNLDQTPLVIVNSAPQIPVSDPKKNNIKHILIPVSILVLVISILSGIAFSYLYSGSSRYTESDFSSSMLQKISTIKSASYTFSAALDVVPRDTDAVPFVMPTGDTEDLRKKYESDVKRLQEVKMIAGELQRDATLSETLKERFPEGGYRKINIIDSFTQKEYEYTLTEDKKDFKLVLTFETDEILQAIKKNQKSGFSPTPDSTVIEGSKVTFNKGSSLYGYVDTELPKPFLTEMSDSMSMIPPDVKGKIAVTASSDLTPGSMANWSLNLDAEGDLSDMTYKVNADVLRKDDNYYFKINNFPGLALFEMAAPLKGKWVVMSGINTAKPVGTTDAPAESSLAIDENLERDATTEDSIQKFEKIYKENRESIFEFIKKIAAAADQEKSIIFKNTPKKEVIDGKELIRYEISIRKDTLNSFVTALRENIAKDPKFIEAFEAGLGIPKSPKATPEEQEAEKKEVEDYFKSEAFNQIFDYIEKNNNFIIWTDADGFPVIIQNTMRIVPADTAEQLQNKQITLVYRLAISNINTPIVLTAPTDAVTWQAISKELNPYQDQMEETKIIAGLSSIKTVAMTTYSTEGSYGKKGFALGPCKPTEGTLFADTDIVVVLNDLTNNNMALATCASRGRMGKVGLWAISIPLTSEPGFSYCIDTNTSKKITGTLKGMTCGQDITPPTTSIVESKSTEEISGRQI